MDDILKLINKGLRKIHEKGERIRSDFDLKEIKQELKRFLKRLLSRQKMALLKNRC